MSTSSFLDPTQLNQVQTYYTNKFDKVKELETNLTTLSEAVDNLDNDYLSLSGGTVTDTVKTTKSTFIDDDEFVTKQYVDDNAGGTSNYTDLTNKPSINNVTLSGNKTLSELGLSEHDNYTKTILWENTSGMTVVSPITLADDYTNYDLIVFELAINAINNIQQFTIDTVAFETDVNCCLSYQGKSMGIHPTTSTSLEAVTWDGGNTYVIQKIYGINLGARKPYKETVLYNNNSSVYGNQNGPLAASLTDFDAVYYYIRYGTRGGINNRLFTFMLNVADLETTTSYNAGTLDGYRWDINFPTMDSFLFSTSHQNDLKIEKIIGISYGGSIKAEM